MNDIQGYIIDEPNCPGMGHIPKSSIYPKVPSHMVVIGGTGSGKTHTIIKYILEGDPSNTPSSERLENPENIYDLFYVDIDDYDYYTSSSDEQNKYTICGCPLKYKKYCDLLPIDVDDYRAKYGTNRHRFIIFDDPPMQDKGIRNMILHYFRAYRKLGISCCLVLHSCSGSMSGFLDEIRPNVNVWMVFRTEFNSPLRLMNLTGIDSNNVKSFKKNKVPFYISSAYQEPQIKFMTYDDTRDLPFLPS